MRIAVAEGSEVEGMLARPADARALLVLAHGAGAPMRHVFLEELARRLASRRVATLRFAFPYAQRGGRTPDKPPVLMATVRAAVRAGASLASGLPLFAGGKSMGGRMTSQAMAEAPLPGVRGLVCVGFPLHPAGQPSTARAAHLAKVSVPMLFLQGTRDTLADLALLRPVVEPMPHATMHVVEGADHGFHVRKSSGRTDAEVLDELAEVTAAWIDQAVR
ncbi:MAG TPA: alpha/beta family hydrolase [Candidatus Polarisedimenticolaceae bacterium]|nr:alpha/beta family hydrolase [Candidatus Polarisedimenticolaceae bacterium]